MLEKYPTIFDRLVKPTKSLQNHYYTYLNNQSKITSNNKMIFTFVL